MRRVRLNVKSARRLKQRSIDGTSVSGLSTSRLYTVYAAYMLFDKYALYMLHRLAALSTVCSGGARICNGMSSSESWFVFCQLSIILFGKEFSGVAQE